MFFSRSWLRFCSVLILFALAALPLSANTIHVPADQPTIQKAIDAASNGDTVLVTDGTYTENIDFKGKAITVKSVNGAGKTTIDGGKLDYVVKFITGEVRSSALDGFTITNGYPGGIAISNASPVILNNIITANTGCSGVGINISFASPLILNNTISNNVQAGCSGGPGGAGMEIIGASTDGAQIVGNTITGNNSGNGVNGGGIGLWTPGPVLIQGNFISGNTSDSGGGIGGANDTSTVRIIQNVITANTAATGGGIEIDNNFSLLLNNTIVNNNSPNGSAIYATFSTTNGPMTASNNLFIGVSGQPAVGCRFYDTAHPPVFSSNNAFTAGGPNYGTGCVDQNGTNGDISADPLFVNSASDFHLQSTSPAIDAGSNSAPDLPNQDIAGNDRILDGKGLCNPVVDMGAYEFARVSFLTLKPTTLPFPDQVVGTTSSPLSSTITNNAATATTVCKVTTSGDFSQTNTCTSIASKGSCSVNVTFTPSAHTSNTGLLQIITNDAGSPQSIVLSGKGVIPVVSLPSGPLNFPAQQVGTTSTQQPITLNNSGDGPLTISNVAVTGDFSETNSCGSTVAPAAACTFNVSFVPTTSGNRAGSLTITDNAAGSPHSINLSGTATDFSLAAASNGSSSASVTAGSPAAYNLQVSALNGFSDSVSLACTGAPSMSMCTVSPTSVTPGASAAPFTVTVTTQAPALVVPRISTRRAPPTALFSLALAFALILLLFFHANSIPIHTERRALLSSLTMLSFAVLCFAACGGGGYSPPSILGTPKGTYTLTVTGTSNSVSHTLTLTLNVG
jgi:hypothetical protein